MTGFSYCTDLFTQGNYHMSYNDLNSFACTAVVYKYFLNRRSEWLSLRYNFNPTRSKYYGKGAGDAEKSRL